MQPVQCGAATMAKMAFEADPETERRLLDSIAQCDRGETIPPGAIRADLERASSLIALQPHIGTRPERRAPWRASPAPRSHPLRSLLPARRHVPTTGDTGVLACQP